MYTMYNVHAMIVRNIENIAADLSFSACIFDDLFARSWFYTHNAKLEEQKHLQHNTTQHNQTQDHENKMWIFN